MAEFSLGEAALGTAVDLKGLNDGMEEARGVASSGASRAADAISVALGVGLARAGEAVLGAMHGIGVAIWDVASQSAQASNEIQAQLGASEEEAARLAETAQGIFGNNFADDIADATQSLIDVRQQMKGLAEEELQGATESALTLRDVFGVEVPESANAANTLMEQFGLTSEEAFDFITYGFQNGLNSSGDFLESIGEYSTQFSSGGATADDFFNVLQSGMQGGVLGTDKAADAFKEFRVRIQDGSALTAESLEAIGISSEEMLAKLASGEMTAAEAFQIVTGALGEVDDKNLQLQAGVGLLGTQFEDLGTEGALSLSMVGTSLEDMAGATDSAGAKYSNLGSVVEGFKRRALLAFEPIGAVLLEIANAVMPLVESAFSWFETTLVPILQNAATVVLNFFSRFSEGVAAGAAPMEMFTRLIQEGLGNLFVWVGEQLPGWIEQLKQWGVAAWQWIVDAIPPLLAKAGEMIGTLLAWVQSQLPGWIIALSVWATQAWLWLQEAVPPLLQRAGVLVGQLLAYLGNNLPGWIAKLLEWGTEAVAWLGRALPPLIVKLGEFLATLINWARDTVLPALIEKAQEWSEALFMWVVTKLIPEIKPKLMEFLETVKRVMTDDILPALGDAAGNIGRAILNGMMGVVDGIVGRVRGVMNQIIDIMNNAIGAFNALPGPDLPLIPGLAQGTFNWGGGVARLFEFGPEAIFLPEGTRVIPAGATARMGGGGDVFNFDLRGSSLTRREVREEFDRAWGERSRSADQRGRL